MIGKVYRNKKYGHTVRITGENAGIVSWERVDTEDGTVVHGGSRKDLFVESFKKIGDANENIKEN